MRTVTNRGLILFITVWLVAVMAPVAKVSAASDPRFFGTYCGEYRHTDTFNYPCFPLFPWLMCQTTYHVDLAFEVHSDYRETLLGTGLVNGHGSATVKSHNLPAGRAEEYGVQVGSRMPFVFGGRVDSYGELEGSVLTPGREPTTGSATLSADGLELELVGLDRTVEVSKDRCGNSAPTTEIETPVETSIPYGHYGMLLARYGDEEDDASIPDERLVWTSDQEEGVVDNGTLMNTSRLSPGRHAITFTATDSGGLSGSDTEVITVENNVPAPVIETPKSDDEPPCEGSIIKFSGYANDDQGNLTGDALVWTATAGNRQTTLGTGTLVTAPLEAGSYAIRLTANDGISSGYDEVAITVKQSEGEVCGPTVIILEPDDRTAPVTGWPSYYNYSHSEVAAEADEQNPFCVWLRAEARGPNNIAYTGPPLVWTDHPQGLFAPRPLGTGDEIYACNFPAPEGEGDLLHTISVRAGTARDQVNITVIGPGAGGVGGVY